MNNQRDYIDEIIASRGRLPHGAFETKKAAEEGGCGVTGFIASVPVRGRHIFEPSVQMHNRGNGKGGGIAAVGLCAEDLGVSQEALDGHYMLQVALLDPRVAPAVEKEYIEPYLDVHRASRVLTVGDYREIPGLEVRPPDVQRYFVRVKKDVLDRFIDENRLQDMDPRKAEDEFIYQNSYRLNQRFYASLGEKQAFVLSHGRNIMILKIVGYAELVARYYLLDNFRAHGWIAHQRYPTKGRVWHPGGAHPFIGMDEALVHNGDFANYHSITEYLKQYNIIPQFLTDTEVSVLLFDLWNRGFGYPLEYIIEAMAPTTEHDFDRLPPDKQHIYRYIQQNHIRASPDGPWFFIIARNDPYRKQFQLIGITDTAMLRPQVFALQDGEVQIGLVCSEKQAIDATLQSLAAEDHRFGPIADKYWNARGGSATDGGAFIFTVKDSPGAVAAGFTPAGGEGVLHGFSPAGGDGRNDNGHKQLICTNKFGAVVTVPNGRPLAASPRGPAHGFGLEVGTWPAEADALTEQPAGKRLTVDLTASDSDALEEFCRKHIARWDYGSLQVFCQDLAQTARHGDDIRDKAITVLTYLNDIRLPYGAKRRSSVLRIVRESLHTVFAAVPGFDVDSRGMYRRIDWQTRHALRAPQGNEKVLVVNAGDFPPEGNDCDAVLIVAAYSLGWKQFIAYGYRGQRFCGCGLAEDSDGVRIDVYDSSGDYLASGIDGLQILVHGNAQDQVGQIMKRGKLVIYGDVGQTFMYGAKGGEVYVLGNAAGRPLINAVGRPRVLINGACLDYLAESFMAGDPLNGGGFVVMNGITLDEDGKVISQESPYPGSNLFSLASGGAIYLRDPFQYVVGEQLNGGEFATLSPKDWELILPYLQENERLFGIKIDDLLTVDGVKKDYREVYRKVQAVKLEVLAARSPAPKPSPAEYADVIPEGEDADE
ncbi:MAG: glutamate synthase [Chloroflexi bacterium]|nr:glutamate synthase [Chloroflexota bacterium]